MVDSDLMVVTAFKLQFLNKNGHMIHVASYVQDACTFRK